MFTEGLDESALSWVNQGSDEVETRDRSPLSPITDRIPFPLSLVDPIPKSSPTFRSSGTLRSSSFLFPPLNFQSGLLGIEKTEESDSENSESVASVSYEGTYTEEDEWTSREVDPFGRYQEKSSRELDEVLNNKQDRVKLRRGLMQENLRIEIPSSFKSFISDGFSETKMTSFPTDEPREKNHPSNVFEGTYTRDYMGPPSAPPMAEIEEFTTEFQREREMNIGANTEETCFSKVSAPGYAMKDDMLEKTYKPMVNSIHDERENDTNDNRNFCSKSRSVDEIHLYSTSGHYAWQTLVAYDACIRLCLYAWARGSSEAPEFLKDECLVLRNAFGLHKFLLQPCGAQPLELKGETSDLMSHGMSKKIIGKLKVEVIKLRLLPRRTLKTMGSRKRSAYIQMGKDYMQQVSSLVRSGISSLHVSSLSVLCEERMSCMMQLKSAAEDSPTKLSPIICLRPGTGDYEVFYPESEGDALLIHVQDNKGIVHGRAIVPIASLNENSGDKIRWWPLYHDDEEIVGKIQLFIGTTIAIDDTHVQSGAGPVVETLAYDLLTKAALRAQNFSFRNLRFDGPWKWLLTEFATYYGVSDSYTKLRYLSHVMTVAIPTRHCFELVEELLIPIIKAKSEKSLTRQEKSVLLDCEARIDSLLANTFGNYKSLDENSPTGIRDNFGTFSEYAAPSLAPAVEVFCLLNDILSQDGQNKLRSYFEAAVKKRCWKHMIETDEFVSGNSDDSLLMESTKSMAYLKMKNLCAHINMEIQDDIKLHNQHILPSSIDLSNISAAIYSTELCKRTQNFLSVWPPSRPHPYVNEFLIAIADFERGLHVLNIRPIEGGVDSIKLFNDYILVWVLDMQLNLQEHCKADTAPSTHHSTAPFADEMYDRIKQHLIEYEVVMNRWPHYSLILENAVADIERTILKSLEKQYAEVLAPLKDSIPKKLNMHVQKLTRRQSTTFYVVPSHLGTFLNTLLRIVDVLHVRVEEVLKSWAASLPTAGDSCAQMNGVTVLLRTKYKNYVQAIVEKLVSNTQAGNRSGRLKKILEDIKEEDGEAEIRDRMQCLKVHIVDSVTNLRKVVSSRIFVAACRGYWDRLGQIVVKYLESRKENRVWYNGCCYVVGVLDDTFASEMQRLLGNSLQDKDLQPPASVSEARSILCRDISNSFF